MTCCPFLTGSAGHPPYLLIAFLIFCVVTLLIIVGKFNALIKLMEKK
jgi:hypothetical protein